MNSNWTFYEPRHHLLGYGNFGHFRNVRYSTCKMVYLSSSRMDRNWMDYSLDILVRYPTLVSIQVKWSSRLLLVWSHMWTSLAVRRSLKHLRQSGVNHYWSLIVRSPLDQASASVGFQNIFHDNWQLPELLSEACWGRSAEEKKIFSNTSFSIWILIARFINQDNTY